MCPFDGVAGEETRTEVGGNPPGEKKVSRWRALLTPGIYGVSWWWDAGEEATDTPRRSRFANTTKTDTMSESLEVHFYTPGDPSAGIFSHGDTLDLGVVPDDIDEEMRSHLRESLRDALSPLYDDRVRISFSDEESQRVRLESESSESER